MPLTHRGERAVRVLYGACVARHAHRTEGRRFHCTRDSVRTCGSGHGELRGERAQLTGPEPERVHARLQAKLRGQASVGIRLRVLVGRASRPRQLAGHAGERLAASLRGGATRHWRRGTPRHRPQDRQGDDRRPRCRQDRNGPFLPRSIHFRIFW